MTREGTRLITAIAAAVLAAGLLVACGDSDSSSTETASNGASAGQETGVGGDTSTEGTGSERPQEGGGAQTGEVEQKKFAPAPLEVSGGGSDQFLAKGGDNSVQEFGEEADESELEEAAEAVHTYNVARAEGDWPTACSYLSKPLEEKLEQLAASSTELEDKSCAPFLEAFTGRLSASEWHDATVMDAGSLRREDEQAFLIYFGAEDTVYSMPLVEEDGEWKVTGLAASAIG